MCNFLWTCLLRAAPFGFQLANEHARSKWDDFFSLIFCVIACDWHITCVPSSREHIQMVICSFCTRMLPWSHDLCRFLNHRTQCRVGRFPPALFQRQPWKWPLGYHISDLVSRGHLFWAALIHVLFNLSKSEAVSSSFSIVSFELRVGQTWDINKPNYAAAKSLVRHLMIARILNIVMWVHSSAQTSTVPTAKYR
jgi:hypothetical protein